MNNEKRAIFCNLTIILSPCTRFLCEIEILDRKGIGSIIDAVILFYSTALE